MWQTPKTDWYGATDANGNYSGDRFNASDYNRIKNNIQYLYELAARLYPSFSIEDMGDDKTPGDWFYADEINHMEKNLNTINANTFRCDYGDAPMYVDNGFTPDYAELNRLEDATADLHAKLVNQFNGRRMFTWNFGMNGGF